MTNKFSRASCSHPSGTCATNAYPYISYISAHGGGSDLYNEVITNAVEPIDIVCM